MVRPIPRQWMLTSMSDLSARREGKRKARPVGELVCLADGAYLPLTRRNPTRRLSGPLLRNDILTKGKRSNGSLRVGVA